jgi:hypothetical protein
VSGPILEGPGLDAAPPARLPWRLVACRGLDPARRGPQRSMQNSVFGVFMRWLIGGLVMTLNQTWHDIAL